ncbi:MAG: hypothetical protein N3A66_00785 [Planctomycetota bacterium]|nr:hypothetical protein [Planctomycetota bacterium]
MKPTFLSQSVLVAIFMAGCPAPAWSAAQAEKSGERIVMQNDLIKLVIDLKKGGRIAEFFYRPFQENIVYPVESCGGMLMDHVWEQTWPGEFLDRIYEGEILKSGPDEAVVRLATMGAGETVKGIRLERRITVKDNDRAVYCAVSLTNTADTGRVTGYWSQNNYWLAGKKEGMTWARPAVRGIDRLGRDEKGNEWFSGAWYYIDDATAGWNAGYHRGVQRGMMFLMDYNDLWRIYDNVASITTEWMYDRVEIPVGKTWSTEIIFFPVDGVTGFVHGSKYAAANFEVTLQGDNIVVEHQIAKGIIPLKNVKLETKAWGLKKPWSVTLPAATFEALVDNAQKATVKAAGIGPMPAGIQVTLTGVTPDGKEITEVYGDYLCRGRLSRCFAFFPLCLCRRQRHLWRCLGEKWRQLRAGGRASAGSAAGRRVP